MKKAPLRGPCRLCIQFCRATEHPPAPAAAKGPGGALALG